MSTTKFNVKHCERSLRLWKPSDTLYSCEPNALNTDRKYSRF